MITSIRSALVLSTVAIVLAACGTTEAAAPDPTPPAPTAPTSPSTPPSESPAEEPAEEPEVIGTITLVGGVAVGGPGGSIADAVAAGMTQPMLVNGTFFRDTDGDLFLADSLTDASAPTFGGPMLRVIDYPDSEEQWDLANAELTGLQEANGVLFFENSQLYGVVES